MAAKGPVFGLQAAPRPSWLQDEGPEEEEAQETATQTNGQASSSSSSSGDAARAYVYFTTDLPEPLRLPQEALSVETSVRRSDLSKASPAVPANPSPLNSVACMSGFHGVYLGYTPPSSQVPSLHHCNFCYSSSLPVLLLCVRTAREQIAAREGSRRLAASPAVGFPGGGEDLSERLPWRVRAYAFVVHFMAHLLQTLLA